MFYQIIHKQAKLSVSFYFLSTIAVLVHFNFFGVLYLENHLAIDFKISFIENSIFTVNICDKMSVFKLF